MTRFFLEKGIFELSIEYSSSFYKNSSNLKIVVNNECVLDLKMLLTIEDLIRSENVFYGFTASRSVDQTQNFEFLSIETFISKSYLSIFK